MDGGLLDIGNSSITSDAGPLDIFLSGGTLDVGGGDIANLSSLSFYYIGYTATFTLNDPAHLSLNYALQLGGNLDMNSSSIVNAININATNTNTDTISFSPVSEPASPSEGMTYYDVDTHKLRVFDGTDWQDCF